MNRMKLQRLLSALLLVFAVTIFVNSVYAQEGVLPAKPQEEVKPSLRSVTFDNFTSVTEEEPQPVQPEEDKESADGSDPFANVSADTDSESPKPPPATEIVGGVKYDSEGMIILGEGQTYELKTGREFQKFQTDNEILKAENDSMHKIFVTGKALGTANLHIYFENGSSQSHSFRVKSDSDSFASIIQQLFPKHKLEIVPIRDTAVFLRGTVETEAEVQQIEEIAGEFWPTVHNHIEAKQPEMRAEFQPDAPGASVQIPRGMRVMTIPIMEWEQNPDGPNFNKVVSLFTTQKISKEGEKPKRFSSDEKLISHNIEIFTASQQKGQKHLLLSLLVTIDQFNLIRRATEKNLPFIAVSQVVNLNNAQEYPSGIDLKNNPQLKPQLTPSRPSIGLPVPNTPNADLEAIPFISPGPGVAQPKTDSDYLPEDQFLPPNSNRSMAPPAINPVPAPGYAPVPVAPPLYQGEPQTLQPMIPSYVDPASPPAASDPREQPQAEFRNAPPTKSQHFNFPVPHSSDVPELSSELAPFQPNATPAPANSLQGDVRALHSDVKKLIELLEKRQAKKEKQATSEPNSEVVPQKGKAILFFHENWKHSAQKLKPMIEKLQEAGLKVVTVNTAEHLEIAMHYEIDTIPALIPIVNSRSYAHVKKCRLETMEDCRKFLNEYKPTISRADQSFSSTIPPTMNIVQISVNEAVPITSNVRPTTQHCSGLIIHKSGEKAYVLTTANLFRKTSDLRSVTISMYTRKDGRYEPEYRKGRLIASDEDADIALLEFYVPYMPFTFIPTKLAANDIKPGDIVSFAGFTQSSRGADEESRRRITGKVASIDLYRGPANFQIADVMPMQGMSGSPVFDKDERLCGIVFAADASEKQTVCTGLEEIKKLLNEASIELPEDRQVSFYMSVAR